VRGAAAGRRFTTKPTRSRSGSPAGRDAKGAGLNYPENNKCGALPPRTGAAAIDWNRGRSGPVLRRDWEVYPMKRYTYLAAAAALLSIVACSEKPGGAAGQKDKPVNVAQDSAAAVTGVATDAAGAVSSDVFVRDAAMGDMYEIEAAKMALARSKSPDVKNLAQMILKDHTASTDMLKMLISSGQVKATLPTALDERRKGLLDDLRGSGGTDFDGRYLKQQTAAHHEAVVLFDGYKTAGSDPALKTFAAEVSPKIHMHLDMANKLDAQAVGHIGSATAPPAAPAS
jgi:putative membrane protein